MLLTIKRCFFPGWRLAILAAVPVLPVRHVNDAELKSLALSGDAAFWGHLAARSRQATSFSELFFLSTLRKKAKLHTTGSGQPKLRLALIGGYNLYPLHELVEHLLAIRGIECERFLGEYDNFVSEILDGSSPLYAFSRTSPSFCRTRTTAAFRARSSTPCNISAKLQSAPRSAPQPRADFHRTLRCGSGSRQSCAARRPRSRLVSFTHAWRRLEFPQGGEP